MTGKILSFRDWHREKWWISFHEGKTAADIVRIQAIETWQWYKVPKGAVFDPDNPPAADKLEISGMVRLTDGQELNHKKLNVVLGAELVEKIAWIARECATRGIPVVRKP